MCEFAAGHRHEETRLHGRNPRRKQQSRAKGKGNDNHPNASLWQGGKEHEQQQQAAGVSSLRIYFHNVNNGGSGEQYGAQC